MVKLCLFLHTCWAGSFSRLVESFWVAPPLSARPCHRDWQWRCDGRQSVPTKNRLSISSLATPTCESVELHGLFQASTAYRNGTLQVDERHTLYYEEHGRGSHIDDEAKPYLVALFLHGGPGAGCFPNHARFFDPAVYQIILLDQRGAGRSTPRGETESNSLLQLVQDCETLRAHLGIAHWDVVLGGSWGATLAIAYAQEFPRSIRALVLRGVCLLRNCEVDWLFGDDGGAARLSPIDWQEFSSVVFDGSPGPRGSGEPRTSTSREVLHAYYDRLLSDNPAIRLAAARLWMKWEFRVFSNFANGTLPSPEKKLEKARGPFAVRQFGQWSFCDALDNEISQDNMSEQFGVQENCADFVYNLRQGLMPLEYIVATPSLPLGKRPVRPVVSRPQENATSLQEIQNNIPAQNILTCFYSVNNGFAMDYLDLLNPRRMERIQHIPCIAVQGGQDLICPIDTALELAEKWPLLTLRIPLSSGHSMYDVAITHELIKATNQFAHRLTEETQ